MHSIMGNIGPIEQIGSASNLFWEKGTVNLLLVLDMTTNAI
jgi:hypothetical protein